MIKTILALIISASSINIYAQRAPVQHIQTTKGNLEIQPITHATFVMNYNNRAFYVDPTGGPAAFAGMAKPDVIIITDIHGDHCDLKTIDSIITPGTIFVVPLAVAEKLKGVNPSRLVILNNGEKTEKAGVPINAIPMYNLPENADSRHTKGRGNGYVINFGGKNIYISGDTEDIPEMRHLKNIDVAFVCMNLPYTMDVRQAASAVLEFKPKIVYPYHYRGQDGLSDVAAFKKIVNEGNKNVDVRLVNWYP